ncbi:unnamed protein product [Rotaria magnacalcarata]|uniref:Uncharacterized protein n=1 Tax=Rotaria magnacalcarata TaxID=392030 RepID=A0A820BEG4_9BILA|nr:unnamed protein product [Rotaria magnacalcarata]
MRQKPTTAKATVKSVKRAGHHSCQPRQNSERKVTHVTHYPSQLGHSMSQMSRHHTDLKKVQRRQLQLQQQQRRQQQQRQQPLHRQPLRPRRQVTTTATTTTVTTPVPPCTPTSVGTASTLFSATSASSSSYQCEAFAWTSPTTGTVTLSFFLRHDPTTWFLDDVSVYYGAVQMLSNGGFESGSMAPWVRSLPNGPCTGWSSAVSTTVYGVLPHSGNYYYIDGSYGCADEISQSFGAIAGEEYIVSFWIQSGSSGSGVSVTITLS